MSSVMIIRVGIDIAATDSVTGTPALTTASEMIAARQACRPTDEPTMTVLLGLTNSSWRGFG
jgi:hypothetical protein